MKVESILGTMRPVMEFATFYENNKAEIDKIYNAYLLDFCDTQDFTPKEMKMYRLGLFAWTEVFRNCQAETETYLSQAEKTNNKSVG